MKIFLFFLILSSILLNLSYGEKVNPQLEFFLESNLFIPSIEYVSFDRNNYFIYGNYFLKLNLSNNLEIAPFFEIYYGLETGDSTFKFIQSINNPSLIPIGEKYDILAIIDGYAFSGISFSKTIKSRNFSLKIIPKLIYGFDIQQGRLWGDFIRLDEESYKFKIYFLYLYNNNYIFKNRVYKRGIGFGYSMDTNLKFHFNPNFEISIFFQNIYGKIYWKNIPFINLKADSEREYFDEYGNIVFKPLISGYEGCMDYTQKLPLSILISINYINYPFSLNFNFNFYNQVFNYNLNFSYLFSKSKEINLYDGPFTKKLGKETYSISIILSGDKFNLYNIMFYFSLPKL